MVMNVSLSYTDIIEIQWRFFDLKLKEKVLTKKIATLFSVSVFSFWQKKVYNEEFYMTKMADDWTMYH